MVFWKSKLYDKLNQFNRLDQLKINLRNQLYLAKLDFKKNMIPLEKVEFLSQLNWLN